MQLALSNQGEHSGAAEIITVLLPTTQCAVGSSVWSYWTNIGTPRFKTESKSVKSDILSVNVHQHTCTHIQTKAIVNSMQESYFVQ